MLTRNNQSRHIILSLGILLTCGSCTQHNDPTTVRLYSKADYASLPPVVTVRTSDQYPNPAIGVGQAVLVGDVLLTAAHVMAENRHPRNHPNLVIHNTWIDYNTCILGMRNSPEFLSELDIHDSFASYDFFAQDWVFLRLNSPPNICGVQVIPETGQIYPGSKVSVFSCSEDGSFRRQLDTYILTATNTERLPNNLVFLANPDGFQSDGWSGSFVGKWSQSEKVWKLIGVFVATIEGTLPNTGREVEMLVVVRPPPELLEWFASGGRGEMPDTGP
jgi:hypothetical protein